jgi:hypothetical protein
MGRLLAAMFFAVRLRSICGAALDDLSDRRTAEAMQSRCHSAITIVCGEGSKSEGALSAQSGEPRSNRMLPRR